MSFICSAFALVCAVAFPQILCAQSARLTTAQVKQNCKGKVVKADNGDVYFDIAQPPADVIKQGGEINPSILAWLAYYDPNYDFEKLNKMTVREAGKGGVPRSMQAMLGAIIDFMATNNVKLRPVKLLPNNVRNRVENGQPYLISIYYVDELDKLQSRSQKRKAQSDMKAWQKTLRDEEIKNFKQSKSSQYAQITGYNKQTGEFRISIGSGAKFWLTEGELKKIASRILEPRL